MILVEFTESQTRVKFSTHPENIRALSPSKDMTLPRKTTLVMVGVTCDVDGNYEDNVKAINYALTHTAPRAT